MEVILSMTYITGLWWNPADDKNRSRSSFYFTKFQRRHVIYPPSYWAYGGLNDDMSSSPEISLDGLYIVTLCMEISVVFYALLVQILSYYITWIYLR